MSRRRAANLGRGFNLFWTGQTVSMAGDKVTVFVVPALMIFALHASALQVGIVSMAQYLGIPLVGPIAGVLVDRWDKRRTMLTCDLVRLAAVVVIPIAYWRHFLSTPGAMHVMRAPGSGVPPSRFRPPVYVTIWS